MDIVDTDYQRLDEQQEETPVQLWLMEHCAEYGFILRYPSDKSDLTGVGYEPCTIAMWAGRPPGRSWKRASAWRNMIQTYMANGKREESAFLRAFPAGKHQAGACLI